jgi:hypothetical protein
MQFFFFGSKKGTLISELDISVIFLVVMVVVVVIVVVMVVIVVLNWM